MNHFIKQLPQVLQNEIWEYVRGDRTYWKQQFQPILKIVKYINKKLWDDMDKFVEENRPFLTVTCGDGENDYVSIGCNGQGCRWIGIGDEWSGPMTRDLGQTVKEFYQCIEQMVSKLANCRG